MTSIVPIGANTGTSEAGVFTMQANTANPFTASNVTWTQAIASTAEAWAGFYLNARIAVADQAIIQVATGAAAAESIIATLPVGMTFRGGRGLSYYVPIPVASGTRVSVGGHSDGTDTVNYQIIGQPSANFDAEPSFTVLESGPYDLDDYTDLFFQIDPGGTAHTKAGWTELSFTGGTNRSNNVLNGDSLGQNYDYFGLIVGDSQTSSQGDNHRLWSLGYGAAASETAIFENMWQRVTGAENQTPNGIIWMPRSGAPAATARIAVDMQCSTNASGSRVGSCVMVGVR